MKSALSEIVELTMEAGTRPVDSGIPRVVMIKGEVPAHQLVALYEPMIGFVVQGTKVLSIGERTLHLEGPCYFLVPTHVPATATVRASRDGGPYLSVGLALNRQVLGKLLRVLPEDLALRQVREIAGCQADQEFIEAWRRMLRLRMTPRDIPALAPVYEREILYRVLMGPQGSCLQQLGVRESHLSKVSQTVQWLRANFAEPIDVHALAAQANVSTTTFHRQFKKATGLSPIQFQKQLRLLEARDLLAFDGYAVASAAYEVGYQSPSQFNREYRRFFGAPPGRDSSTVRALEGARSD